jgi:hypothetical protein
MAWTSSGQDSGPPTENFLVFFVRWAVDPFTAIFPPADVGALLVAGDTAPWPPPHHSDLIPGVLRGEAVNGNKHSGPNRVNQRHRASRPARRDLLR